ncbi:glycosyltransferase [Methanobacterium spitsbergense]|uniref:Glycosyltransferase n=1 Tax=Methanobacterium spitsbergense TaxID=2874285 RepID=A0A8T5V2L8_9EURY|nr:glycosyltransferase [Methanobacterium spitsbergense]MBZ2165915.1 glycosyltransferase [Methanobacterium spitsbergense]
MVKVSVIVPVYNVEKYLRQCLESILNQTLIEIEIICVNDGSTDKSSQILEEYAEKYKQITVINQENKGIGLSRNAGMECATGEYIGFVDSDDWIDEKMYETMYINAKSHNSDIVMCLTHLFDDAIQEYKPSDPYFALNLFNESFDNTVFDHKLIKGFFGVNVTCWNKIYRSKFLNVIEAKFPKIDFEDNIFFYKTYLNAKKISLVRKFLYNYRINRQGSFIDAKNERFFDIIKMHSLLEGILIETSNLGRYKQKFLNYQVQSILNRYNQVDEQYKKEFFDIIKQHFLTKDFSPSDIDMLNNNYRIKYQNILNSETYREYEQLEKNQKPNDANRTKWKITNYIMKLLFK